MDNIPYILTVSLCVIVEPLEIPVGHNSNETDLESSFFFLTGILLML